MSTIGEFLVAVSEDTALLERYLENPKAALDEFELPAEKQEIVLSDEPVALIRALQEEFPELAVEAQQWKPIRFPLPIPRPRPIRRAPVHGVNY